MGCGSSSDPGLECSTTYDDQGPRTTYGSSGHQPMSPGQRPDGVRDDQSPSPPPPPAEYNLPPPSEEDKRNKFKPVVVEEEEEDEQETRPDSAVPDVIRRLHDVRPEHMGRITHSLDTRSSAPPNRSRDRPHVTSGQLWEDNDFLKVALSGIRDARGIEWKRPHELAPAPALFTEGTTRFDIGQGSAGTCWFLSILASLADKKGIIEQIIPEQSYRIGSEDYDGIFHCRFWRFGQWEDVYVDDRLPVHAGTTDLWGAKSATDNNELWVPLMEKAFAKYHGSYQKAWGGWAGDAFIDLTGGIAETVKTEEVSGKALFCRIKNEVASGAVIACSVPAANDDKFGLVGGHAYTLTGITTLNSQGKAVQLLRIRNPWGGAKGEWTGPWGDGTSEWNSISSSTKEKLNVQEKGDGEFWICLKDYRKMFNETHFCNFTPTVNVDGKNRDLNQASCIFGEWKGETAAGSSAKKLKNQKFTFTVHETDLSSKGEASIVVQFIQHRMHRHDDEKNYIRADLFKLDSLEEVDGKRHLVLYDITNKQEYVGGWDVVYRYNLVPGPYMLVPTTMDEGKEDEFILRVFSQNELFVTEAKDEALSFYIRDIDLTFTHDGQQYAMPNQQHVFGEWRGRNAGGQVKYKTFCNNPQYHVTVTGSNPVPLTVSLMQEAIEPRHAIGFKIFPVPPDIPLPMDLRTCYRYYDQCVQDIKGQSVFIDSYQGESHYLMKPGNYVILIFTNDAGAKKQFSLGLATCQKSSIKIKGYNCTH